MTPEEQARDFAKRCGWEQGEAGSTEKGWRRVHEDDLTQAFLAHRRVVLDELLHELSREWEDAEKRRLALLQRLDPPKRYSVPTMALVTNASTLLIAEIVGPSGRVHCRRPPDDPLVEQARSTPGYTVRLVERETIETPEYQIDDEAEAAIGCSDLS